MIWEQKVGTAMIMVLAAFGIVAGAALFLSSLFASERGAAMLGLVWWGFNLAIMHNADSIGRRHEC